MAPRTIVSRLTRPDKENIRSQGVFDGQRRLYFEKSRSKNQISLRVFDSPEDDRWNGENLLSFLERLQRFDTAPGIRKIGELQAAKPCGSGCLQPAFHGLGLERVDVKSTDSSRQY